MLRVLTALALILCAAGCWTPGSIHEGIPKHTEKFAKGTSFFVEDTEPRVEAAFKRALEKKGFVVKGRPEDAEFVISAKVTSWEFNDAGFSGLYDRDDMTLAITISDSKTKFIRTRSTIVVKSSFRIVDKYVETL